MQRGGYRCMRTETQVRLEFKLMSWLHLDRARDRRTDPLTLRLLLLLPQPLWLRPTRRI